MKIMLIIVSLLLLLLFSISCTDYYDLTILVEDNATKEPIVNPRITVEREGNWRGLHSYYNDNCCYNGETGGRYREVPEGDVDITIKKSGYNDYSKTINLTGDEEHICYLIER